MGYAGAGGASCEVYTPIYHGAFVWRHIALDSGLALQDSPPCSSSVLTNEGVTVVGHQLRAFQGRIYAGWRTVHVGQLRAPALRSARTWRSRTVRYPAPPSSQTKKRRSLVTSYARFFRDTDIRPMTDRPRGTKFRAPALISNPGLALQDSSPSSSSVLANEGATVVGHQLRAFQGHRTVPSPCPALGPGLALQDSPPSSSSVLTKRRGGGRGSPAFQERRSWMEDRPRRTALSACPALGPDFALQDSPSSNSSVLTNEGGRRDAEGRQRGWSYL